MGKRQHQLLTALMAGLLTVGPWELSAASNVPLLIEQPSDELETSLVHSISIRSTVPDKSQEVDAQVIKARMRTKEKDLFMQSAFDADLKMLA